MSTELSAQWAANVTGAQYLQDDVVRVLRTSLVEVLGTALADSEANPDFLRGVLSLARSLAPLIRHLSETVEQLKHIEFGNSVDKR